MQLRTVRAASRANRHQIVAERSRARARVEVRGSARASQKLYFYRTMSCKVRRERAIHVLRETFRSREVARRPASERGVVW